MRWAIFAATMMLMNQPVPASAVTWPQGKQAAIVLSYDDGLQSQLDTAIPQLEHAGFKATFFLNDLKSENIGRWRAAAALGHELGNHTVTHPCPLAILPDRKNATDSYEVSWMLGEIGMMNGELNAINGSRTRTMAYPCSQSFVKTVNYKDALRETGLVKYARTGGNRSSAVVTNFATLDYLEVPSFDPVPGGGPAGVPTGAELIAFVKQVQATGGMGVFQFHGVGGDYLSIPASAHQELLDYLSSQPDIWVGTFQDVLDYSRDRK